MRRSYFWLFFTLILCASAILVVYLLVHKEKKKDELILYGNVDVRQVDLGFRVDGRVTCMPFQEGDFVPQGTLMGTLETQPWKDQVEEAQANIQGIEANLANSELVYTRRAQLVEEGAVSQEEFDNALASRDSFLANLLEAKAALGVALKNLEDIQLYCPNDGTILTRIREPGAVVREGDPIYTLSLVSPVWVRAYVPEPLLGQIYYGMKAEVITDKGPTYEGHIGFISPVAEFTPKTVETTELRTDLVYRLRIIADNPDRYLKQGMPVTVKLHAHQN